MAAVTRPALQHVVMRLCISGPLAPFRAAPSGAALRRHGAAGGVGPAALRRAAVVVRASGAASAGDPSGDQNSGSFMRTAGSLAAVAALAAGGALVAQSSLFPELLATGKAYVSSSILAKSGFFAAFSLIFASEIGDKTFFIAALLAMRCGKWISFVGSVAALSVMTFISVAIGFAVKRVPAVVESSEQIGQWLGAALLLYFGVRTLKDAWSQSSDGDELEEAEQSVTQAEKGGKIGAKVRTPWQVLVEVFSLIFVAEWGDRSMLATIALGAAQSPLGVATGAIAGHALATLIAVVGGAVLSKHISEKTVGYIGGSLFILFAVATVGGIL